jgi:glycosyl transferase family 25
VVSNNSILVMTNFPIYLINLDGSDDRLATAASALEAQGAAFTRVSAYDGRKTDPLTVSEYDSVSTRRYVGRDLNGGEVGCFFSHIRAAQAFLDTDAPFALVLEDDAVPAQQGIALTNALINWQVARGDPDWHLAHLGNPRLKYTSPIGQISADGCSCSIVRAHYFPVTTSALLWSRAGAQIFVDGAYPMDCPVDHFMRRWLTQTDMGIAIAPGFFVTTDVVSDIDKSHTSKRRGSDGRSLLYGWRKAKRMWGDKIRAMRHKQRHAKRAEGAFE